MFSACHPAVRLVLIFMVLAVKAAGLFGAACLFWLALALSV